MSKNSVREILQRALSEAGADGLCRPDGVPCGCGLNELFNCCNGDEVLACVPAKKLLCAHEECNHYMGPCEATKATEWCYVQMDLASQVEGLEAILDSVRETLASLPFDYQNTSTMGMAGELMGMYERSCANFKPAAAYLPPCPPHGTLTKYLVRNIDNNLDAVSTAIYGEDKRWHGYPDYNKVLTVTHWAPYPTITRRKDERQ